MQRRAVPVDATDLRILRELLVGSADRFQTRRERIRDVAERLGLHRNTVLRRLLRMRRLRFILPAVPLVELGRWGYHGGRAFLAVPADNRTEAMRDRLFERPWVLAVVDHVEGWEVALNARDADERQARMLEACHLLGAPGFEWMVLSPEEFGGGEPLALDELDRRLILALCDDVHASIGTLARRLGEPKRTVQYRFHRMQANGMIRMFPGGGGTATGQTILYVHVDFTGPSATIKAAQAKALEIFSDHMARGIYAEKAWLTAFAGDPPSLYDKAETLRRVPGVARVRTTVMRGLDLNPNYPAWLGQQLANLPAAPAMGKSRVSGSRPTRV